MNTKCGKLNSVLCFVVAVTVVVNCILFILLGSLNCEKEWKKGRKIISLSFFVPSPPLPSPFYRICYRNFFFRSKQNKKWGKLFSFVYLYVKEVRKSFVPKKVVIVCFDFFFRKSKYSDKISISRNHIEGEKKFHCFVCAPELKKRSLSKAWLTPRSGCEKHKSFESVFTCRKCNWQENQTKWARDTIEIYDWRNIVTCIYRQRSLHAKVKAEDFPKKRREKTNKTSEKGKE